MTADDQVRYPAMADSKKDAKTSFTQRAREALSGAAQASDEGGEAGGEAGPYSSGSPEPAAPSGFGSGPSEPASPRIPSLDRFITDAQSKISEVIDAAERVAKDTHADAKDQANTYLEDRKRDADALVVQRREELNSITAAVAKRVGQLRQEVDSISAEIGSSIERIKALASSTGGSPAEAMTSRPMESSDYSADFSDLSTEPSDAQGSAEPALHPVADEESSSREADAPSGEADAPSGEADDGDTGGPGVPNRENVVLRATQLAVAGTERGEIEATLTQEFGIEDASAIVDEIVGPAS
jgi:hypothetical protein